MFFGTSIERPPGTQPNESDRAGDDERGPPTVPDRYDRDHEWCNERADIGARVEDSGCESALFFRKPLGDCFDRGRKVSCFTKTEEETRDAKAKDRMSQGVTHRCETPEDDCE